MKTPRYFLLLLALFLLVFSGAKALAQESKLVYKGRLADGGNPAAATFEMEFKLFDTPDVDTGTQQGETISDPAVAVANGEFSVTLDFGAAAFDGSPRYLEVGVKRAGSADPYVVLAPRQSIAPVPYAIQSLNAAQLNGLPATSFLQSTPSGSVGIGTDNPQALLHLYWQPDSLTHLIETGGGTNAWAKVGFKNLNGEWDIGTSRAFNNDVFYIDRLGTPRLELQLSTGGGLGLGIEPQAKLHLYEAESLTHLIECGGGINAWAKVSFRNAHGQWDIGTSRGFNGDQFYVARSGASEIAFAVQPNGDTYTAGNARVRTLEIAGGADLAEPFPLSDATVEKGSVVVIDAEHPGRLKVSTRAYDKRVAGIVSGANGIQPGISLRQEGALEPGENVALTGRVYVRADATHGAIEPGDLLTTSDRAGHAMKATDHDRAQGAILGKAMSALDAGQGMVLVLVTLQ